MDRRVVFIVVLFFFVSVDGLGFPTTLPPCPTVAPTCPPPPPPPEPCPPPPNYQPCPPPPQYEPPPPCPTPAAPPSPPCPPPPAPPAPPPPPPSPPPAENDCCHDCVEPCRYKTRKALGSKTAQEGDEIGPHRNVNAKCNSEKLRQIMRLAMFADTRESKFAIQQLAQETLGGEFSVICTNGHFSYVVKTNFFCQETHNDLTCYAFQSA